ncbi:hypothetical protein ACLI4Z_03815 [Natrialbaceae archaeon A-arb3/5]
MLSRENAVILGSLALLFAVALFVLPVLESVVGLSINDQPLAAFVVFAGLAVVLPQLYLARTDDEASPQTRIRLAAVATAAFAVMFAEPAELEAGISSSMLADPVALQHALLVVIAVGAFVVLLCYEFVAGYRSQNATDGASRSR